MDGIHDSALIGVGGHFSASHNDQVRQELHGHSYEVTAWWPAIPSRDATCLQVMLQQTLKAAFDHKTLPPEQGTMEGIAAAICQLLDCVAVDIARPVERLYLRWRP